MNTSLTTGTGPRRRDIGRTRTSRTGVPSMHWLFRTNIPRKRSSYIAPDFQKRNFFGMSDIFHVLASPAETARSLTESRKMLDEARKELRESRERSQLRPKHTFSRLPGFYARKAEIQALERALGSEPSFTILFGASSTGKTALLREVLSKEQYHVLHFDLRISGFADLASLYMSLSQQMELYFETISRTMDGYGDFEKEAWAFKHDRIDVEKRICDAPSDSRHRNVKTSDIARLMELFQSSLLKYWEFRPTSSDDNKVSSKESNSRSREFLDNASERTQTEANTSRASRSRSRFTLPRSWRTKPRERPRVNEPARAVESERRKEPCYPPKIPVFLLDEAHKLPALIQSPETMKCLLDSMLVLTKQDRLCHVIHATSDPFYQTWLRQLNVMQHCKIITIGDCSKAEMRSYFREKILPRVPERLRSNLDFEILYDAFGGKLAHWQDYINDYINSNGRMDIKQSSHFLQAHALLNLHIIHSSQTAAAQEAAATAQAANTSNPETLHPGLGPAGFKIYSPVTAQSPTLGEDNDRHNTLMAGVYSPEFSAMQLLKVMSRLTHPDTEYIPYFLLCREMGVRAVDGMIKGRLLELRWTETITKEGAGAEEGRIRSGMSGYPSPGMANMVNVSGNGSAPHLQTGTVGGSSLVLNANTPGHYGQGSSATAIVGGSSTLLNTTGHFGQGSSATAIEDIDETMMPISEQDPESPAGPRDRYEEVMEVVGPKLLPTTPIMRYAMRDVVQEYEDDGTVSEYASFVDPDEY